LDFWVHVAPASDRRFFFVHHQLTLYFVFLAGLHRLLLAGRFSHHDEIAYQILFSSQINVDEGKREMDTRELRLLYDGIFPALALES
jgi:hypothetical protein